MTMAEHGRHGNQPPLKDRLSMDYEDMTTAAEKLAGEANAAPTEVTGEADLVALGLIVKGVRDLRKKANDTRVAEKDEFLQAGKDVDAFFNTVIDRMKRIQDALEARASAYQNRIAEEQRLQRAQAVRLARDEEERQRQIAEAEAARNRPTAAANHEAQAERLHHQAEALEVPAAAPDKVRTADVTVSSKGKWTPTIVDYDAMDLNELRFHFTRADVEKALRSYVKVNEGARPLAGVKIEQERKANFR